MPPKAPMDGPYSIHGYLTSPLQVQASIKPHECRVTSTPKALQQSNSDPLPSPWCGGGEAPGCIDDASTAICAAFAPGCCSTAAHRAAVPAVACTIDIGHVPSFMSIHDWLQRCLLKRPPSPSNSKDEECNARTCLICKNFLKKHRSTFRLYLTNFVD
jgi:hypothetical protein